MPKYDICHKNILGLDIMGAYICIIQKQRTMKITVDQLQTIFTKGSLAYNIATAKLRYAKQYTFILKGVTYKLTK
jgi:hypothetical protein